MTHESNSPFFLRCRLSKAGAGQEESEASPEARKNDHEAPPAGECCDECQCSIAGKGVRGSMPGSDYHHYRS
jgi:hypothetical protein